jgi:hypothetical protein
VVLSRPDKESFSAWAQYVDGTRALIRSRPARSFSVAPLCSAMARRRRTIFRAPPSPAYTTTEPGRSTSYRPNHFSPRATETARSRSAHGDAQTLRHPILGRWLTRPGFQQADLPTSTACPMNG